MYPYTVLGVAHDTTDEEVEARYQELVKRWPPHAAPQRFRAIREAYEALRDAQARLETRLRYFDATGRALEDPAGYPAPGPRRRVSPEALAELVRRSLDVSR